MPTYCFCLTGTRQVVDTVPLKNRLHSSIMEPEPEEDTEPEDDPEPEGDPEQSKRQIATQCTDIAAKDKRDKAAKDKRQ